MNIQGVDIVVMVVVVVVMMVGGREGGPYNCLRYERGGGSGDMVVINSTKLSVPRTMMFSFFLLKTNVFVECMGIKVLIKYLGSLYLYTDLNKPPTSWNGRPRSKPLPRHHRDLASSRYGRSSSYPFAFSG